MWHPFAWRQSKERGHLGFQRFAGKLLNQVDALGACLASRSAAVGPYQRQALASRCPCGC
eukprot:5350376-Amphidinium_carterae.2